MAIKSPSHLKLINRKYGLTHRTKPNFSGFQLHVYIPLQPFPRLVSRDTTLSTY